MKNNIVIWIILLLINTSVYAVSYVNTSAITSNPNEMKAEVIFNKIEEVYSGFVYPHADTTSSNGFYSRSYENSPVPYVRINMETGEIWYLWNNDWVYFLTLDEANETLCNNLCFNDVHMLSILPESESESESYGYVSYAYASYAYAPSITSSHTYSGVASHKERGSWWWSSDPIENKILQVVYYEKSGYFLSNRVSKKISTDSDGRYNVYCEHDGGRCQRVNRVIFFYEEDGVSYCAGPYELTIFVSDITLKDCRL